MPEKLEADARRIEKRLDAMIRILLRPTEVQEMSSRDQIALLHSTGLGDSEIANILGRSRGYVASELTQIRKREKSG